MSSPIPIRLPSVQTEVMEIPPAQLQVSDTALETRAMRDQNAIRTLFLQKLDDMSRGLYTEAPWDDGLFA